LALILEGKHGIAFRQAQRLSAMVGGHHGVFPTSAEINDCCDRKEVLGGEKGGVRTLAATPFAPGGFSNESCRTSTRLWAPPERRCNPARPTSIATKRSPGGRWDADKGQVAGGINRAGDEDDTEERSRT